MSEKRMYRYFADLRHGSFIYVTKNDDSWPPVGYPVVELSEDDVKKFLEGGDENASSSLP